LVVGLSYASTVFFGRLLSDPNHSELGFVIVFGDSYVFRKKIQIQNCMKNCEANSNIQTPFLHF